jgi:hypothetical protein
MSWNTKTVKQMAELGYIVTIVEKYNGFGGVKVDYLGFIDAVGLNPDAKRYKTLGIQITSASNVSTRWRKIVDVAVLNKKTGEVVENKVRANAMLWLRCGNGIWIVGWGSDKMKDRKCRIREIFLDEYGELTYTETKGG